MDGCSRTQRKHWGLWEAIPVKGFHEITQQSEGNLTIKV